LVWLDVAAFLKGLLDEFAEGLRARRDRGLRPPPIIEALNQRVVDPCLNCSPFVGHRDALVLQQCCTHDINPMFPNRLGIEKVLGAMLLGA
jgi:hypothetical protein